MEHNINMYTEYVYKSKSFLFFICTDNGYTYFPLNICRQQRYNMCHTLSFVSSKNVGDKIHFELIPKLWTL